MPPTYTLHVLNPDVPPGERWGALWGPARGPAVIDHGRPSSPRPTGPCDPPIEAPAAEWLEIAAAIDSGEPVVLRNVEIGGTVADRVSLKTSRAIVARSTGYGRRLGPDDLLALAADIRAKLATPDRDLKPDNAAPAHPLAEDGSGPTTGAATGYRCLTCGDNGYVLGGVGGMFDEQAEDPCPDCGPASPPAPGPRPTVAEQPPQAPAWTVTPVHNGLTRHTITRGRVRLTVLSGYDDGTTHGEIAIVYGPGREDLVRKSWFGGANRTAEESLAEALDGTLSMAREIGAVATPPALPADLRGLLDAIVAAQDARLEAAIPGGEAEWQRRSEAFARAAHAVAEWHRGAGGGR